MPYRRPQNRGEPERTGRSASKLSAMIKHVHSFVLDVMNEWRNYIVKAIAGLVISVVATIGISARDNIKIWIFGFDDPATALRYAKLTHLGAAAITAKAYYDPKQDVQYVAAAYKKGPTAMAEAFKIVGDRAISIGAPLTIYDNVRGLYDHPNELEMNKLLHYFGFVRVDNLDSDPSSRVMLYGVEKSFISAGVEAEVSLSALDTNERFAVRDFVYEDIPLMRPRLSRNTSDSKISQWLIFKVVEILSTENWESIPLDKFHNGLLASPQQEEYFPASYTRTWFEQNGIDRVTGSITPIEVPVKLLSEVRAHNPCTLDINGAQWMAIFKGPMMRYDIKRKKLFVVYVADPRNNAQPAGIIEGKDYLWLGVGVLSEDKTYLIAMRKSDNRFLKIPIVSEKIEIKDEFELDEEDATVSGNFPEEAPLKDKVYSPFVFLKGALWAEGLKVEFLKANSRSDDEASVDFKTEFLHPRSCEKKPVPEDENSGGSEAGE